jgi:hypothetical protein
VACACRSEILLLDIHPHPDVVQLLCDSRLLHQISNSQLQVIDDCGDAAFYINVGDRAR